MPPRNAHRRKTNVGYIPSLDGWRAIAILAVMFYHDPDTHGFWIANTRRLHEVGWAGVDLFFAISGLLICSRLLEEERLNGAISLQGFYVRRFFRIFPPAWAFLAVSVILGSAHLIPFSLTATLAAAFMVSNYYTVITGDPSADVYSDHFWSLSVEEHFYLILPGVLVFVRRRILALGVLAAAALLWSVSFMHFRPAGPNLWNAGTGVRIHSLLIPALLALLLAEPRCRAFAVKWLRPWFCIAALAIIALEFHKASAITRSVLLSVAFPLVIASTMLHPDSIACRVLEFRPLRYIGRLSYGLYLWQQIFVIRQQSVHWPMNVLQQFPYNYIAAAVCTLISYYLLERAMIALGHRLAPPATPGRPELEQRSSTRPGEVIMA